MLLLQRGRSTSHIWEPHSYILRHAKGKRSCAHFASYYNINSIKKLHFKQCTSWWDLDAHVNEPNTCMPPSLHVLPELSSFPWQRTWLVFQAQLINIRRYIVTVNTMANGNYGQILNNFMGELPSPPGNTASMTDLTLAASQHICVIACIWLTHSPRRLWMFHSCSYRENQSREEIDLFVSLAKLLCKVYLRTFV